MKRFIASLIIIFSFSVAFAQDLKLASYNMMRLGTNNHKDYTTLASVVNNFDIVGAIEVINEKGLASIESVLPSGWKYIISPNSVGEKTYREYYGFLYNDKVEVVKDVGFFPNKENEFARPPYCVQFRDKASGFVFNVAIIHVIYGVPSQRIAEINNLGKAYTYFENETGNLGNTIIAGDFNEENIDSFKSIIDLGTSEVSSIKKTTLGESSPVNDYDHMFVSLKLKFYIKEADVYYWTTDFAGTRKTVSDHFPVYCVFDFNKKMEGNK